MKKVNIDQKSIEKLSNIITEYAKFQIKNSNNYDNNIYGIYLLYYNQGNEKHISYNCITNNNDERLFAVRKIIDDIDVYFYQRSFNNYNTGLFNNETIKACKDLVNSTILYDKTGELTELQNSLIENSKLKPEYDNLIEFEPPLELKKIYRVPVKKIKR